MSKLFVANVSKQNHIIYFRLDYDKAGQPLGIGIFRPANASPVVGSGRQVQLGGDLHMNQVASIILQLSVYGAINEDEVKRTRGRITYICQVDRPVSTEAIRLANNHNNGILEDDGRSRRKRAAVAANASVDLQLQSQMEPQPPVREFDMSVEQEDQSEHGERRIEEGFRIDHDATSPQPPRGRARRRAA